MAGKRIKPGIVALCTLCGGVLTPYVLAPFAQNPETGSRGGRQREWEEAALRYVFEGAAAGFAIGLVIDFGINGRPQRRLWRFRRVTCVWTVIASVVVAWGIKTFWEIVHLPPPNY